MDTLALVIFGVRHNWNVLYNKLIVFFYKTFDAIEEKWWLLKNKGKSSGDYHLMKLGDEIRTNGDARVTLYSSAIAYLSFMGWDPNSERTKLLLAFYIPEAYSFLFDKFRLTAAMHCFSLKNMGDLIDMTDFIGAVTIAQITNKVGESNYQKLRSLDYRGIRETLETMAQEKK